LAVNNIRDRAQDELVGKKTLAVRLGDVKARRMFVALLVLAEFICSR
jgi:1,4-dihydroxy-2-naphthoate octaprenyltransferase